jgi:alkylhydroperoxidase family enzyme
MHRALPWPISVVAFVGLFIGTAAPGWGQSAEAPSQHRQPNKDVSRCFVPLLDDDDAWARLPPVEEASSARLPHWARALAGTLPRTTAAMLDLDYLYRTSDAFDPRLRARMRWVAARANRCEYSQDYARADLLRAGGNPANLDQPAAGTADLSPGEQAALRFARKMTLNASSVTDEEVGFLIDEFGEPAVVAMVLQLAYANFQDRLLTTLGIAVEPEGPLAPLEILFGIAPPDQKPQPAARPPIPHVAPSDASETIAELEWKNLTFAELQRLMEEQRARPSRITVPVWEDVRGALDARLYPPDRPLRIKWSLVVLGNQARLGSAWINCLRTFGREADQDRVFEETLFWVVTRSLQCLY